jgi:hypothetical protein
MLNCDDIALIDEFIDQKVATSASPGFSWGRSGNVASGAWLQNDTVPSNITGRHTFLKNARIKKVFIANETLSTFTLDIYEHDGVTYTLLQTITVTNLRKYDESVDTAITYNKELAIQIGTGSCKNIVCGLLIKGDLS